MYFYRNIDGPEEDDIISDISAQEAQDIKLKIKEQHSYAMTVLSVTTVGALLASIQGSALLIVLPEMMGALHMEFITMLWVLLVYLMVTTIMVPVLGRLSDMFGRKKMYVLGFAVFSLGSLLCGFSDPGFNGWDMVGFRIVQALGGAMLLANSSAMITDAFRKERLGFGLGVNQVAVAAGFVIGPVVGGILAPLGWEWVFFVNIPIGIFGTLWAAYRLREPRWEVKERKFDWIGTVAFFVGLFGILTAFTYMSFGDPSMMFTVYLMSAIGAAGLIAFVFVELRASHPMMDLRLFRERNYAVGNFNNLLNGLCIGAATFLLIFYFQGPCGKDALTAGLLLIPSGLPMMIMGPLSGRWSDVYGPRFLTATGLALTTVSLMGLAFINGDTPLWQVVILMIVMGVGGGMFASPNASSVMTAVPPERRGTASGARMMLRNTGSMFSLAIAFPLVLAGLSQEDMYRIFLGEGVELVSDTAISMLEAGLSEAFTIFAVVSAVSVAVALMKPGKKAV
jgi:EmrB/QacA subfamily drug resistance transporter